MDVVLPANMMYAEEFLTFDVFANIVAQREKGLMYIAITVTAVYTTLVSMDKEAHYDDYESMVPVDTLRAVQDVIKRALWPAVDLGVYGIRPPLEIIKDHVWVEKRLVQYGHVAIHAMDGEAALAHVGRAWFLKILNDSRNGKPDPVNAVCNRIEEKRQERLRVVMNAYVQKEAQWLPPGTAYRDSAAGAIRNSMYNYANREKLHTTNVGSMLLFQVIEKSPFAPRQEADIASEVDQYMTTTVIVKLLGTFRFSLCTAPFVCVLNMACAVQRWCRRSQT